MLHQKTTLLAHIKAYRVHIISWFLFISYEIVMVGLINGKFAAIPYYVAYYVLNIMLFYFFAHKILPFALQNKHTIYMLLPISLGGTFALYYLITICLDSGLKVISDDSNAFELVYSSQSVLRSLYRFLLFVGFSTGYYYLITFLKARKLVEEAENEKLRAEILNQNIQSELVKSQNAFLKAQINPHFLFNTLNFLYTSTRKVAPDTAEAIMVLADIMRFSIDVAGRRDQSDVLTEMQQVHNLIYLYRLRIDWPMYVDVFYDETELAGVRIIPLLIVTLVENIFKHADLERADRPAILDVSNRDGLLQISTTNYRHDRLIKSHNIGLRNIEKRLQLSYGDGAQITVNDANPSIFTTTISIRQTLLE
ncbi:MAG: hypothetical protein EOO20_18325 [Chryseobacterium sp.]|nr:MAG: hypothetical protein EOO20_18325 [Chryseobacterium sp.]